MQVPAKIKAHIALYSVCNCVGAREGRGGGGGVPYKGMQWAACILLGATLWIQFIVSGTISQSLSSVCMCTQLV